MKWRHLLIFCLIVIILLWLLVVPHSAKSTSGMEKTIGIETSSAPEGTNDSLLFIENVGQFASTVRFQMSGADAAVHLTDDAIWFTIPEQSTPQEAGPIAQATPTPEAVNFQEVRPEQTEQLTNIRVQFLDAQKDVKPVPYNPVDTSISYFKGNKPTDWHAGVPVWRGLRYKDLYPGVDLILDTSDGRWLWELQAESEQALTAIQIQIDGADELSIGVRNELLIETKAGNISGPKAFVGELRAAAVHLDNNIVRFTAPTGSGGDLKVIEVNSSIDDELLFSTFLGGSGFDEANSIIAGAGGAVYLVGETTSWNFPTTPGVVATSGSGSADIFITKLKSGGDGLAFSTFLGGSGTDQGYSIAVGGNGEIFVSGISYSNDYPVTSGSYDTTYSSGGDVVVTRLNSAGTDLIYSTYIGHAGSDLGLGIGIDGVGAAYVTGHTSSAAFPTTPGVLDPIYSGGWPFSDAFVLKLNPNGNSLIYSTYLGDVGEDYANDIHVSYDGHAYVVGWTNSVKFPVTVGSFNTGKIAISNEVFLVKLNKAGSGLVYGGLISGIGDDQGQGVDVNIFGEAFIAGQTNSADFPVTAGALQTTKPTIGLQWDGFVAKINAPGDTLVYNTFLGGSNSNCETIGIDRECAIAVDSAGVAYVAGRTQSNNFPTTADSFDPTYNGNEDGFMVKLNPAGSTLLYGSFFGGSSSDQTLDVSVDTAGFAYIAGRTYSSNFPVSASAYDITYNGGADAFVTKLLVGGYVSGPPADPDRSLLSAAPASLKANGTDQATITIRLLSSNGEPAWGKTILLASDRAALDTIAQPTTVTDSLGYTTASVRSDSEGVTRIYAFVLDDGVLLNSSASVSFTSYIPPDSQLIFRINSLANRAIESFGWVNDSAQQIAEDGDFFRGAIDADKAQRAINVAFNMANLIGSVNDTRAVRQGMGVGLPGMESTDGPFWPNTVSPEMYPQASHLFRSNVWFLLRETDPQRTAWEMREELAYTGMKFFAAELRNSGLKYVSKTAAETAIIDLFVSREDGLTFEQAPAITGLANDLSQMIDVNRQILLNEMPELEVEATDAYIEDLTSRTKAVLVLGSALEDERFTIDNFRQAYEDSDLRQKVVLFLLRWLAKASASAAFDGPGTVAVGGALGIFDYYMDTKQLEESTMMAQLAESGMLGAPDALRQLYCTAYSGLERIARWLPADTARGEITGVSHMSQGSGWGPFWEESASWTDVYLKNSGASETTYLVLSDYLADTTRFGVPWNTLNMVEQASIILGPGEGRTVRIDYKRGDGSKGFSPREAGCLPGVGCIPATEINITVLGTNETGTFYIDKDNRPWEPNRVSNAGVQSLALDAGATIDPPLTAYIQGSPWTQVHEAQLWLNNPFSSTVEMNVTQPLPVNISLLDTGGGILDENELSWVKLVEPQSLSVVTFTMKYLSTPGEVNTLPSSILELNNPISGQKLAAKSNQVPFYGLWPVIVYEEMPTIVQPGVSAYITVTVTNMVDSASTSGNLSIQVKDENEVIAHMEKRGFKAIAGGATIIDFELPASLAAGDYIVEGTITVNGVKENIFSNWLQIGLPGPMLNYIANPTGFVDVGDVIAYKLQFTNNVGVGLHQALLSASIPKYTSPIVESIGSGGIVAGDEIRWNIGYVAPSEEVSVVFEVEVNEDAQPIGGDGRRLTSKAWLTAEEITPTSGSIPWNMIESLSGIYIPIIARK